MSSVIAGCEDVVVKPYFLETQDEEVVDGEYVNDMWKKREDMYRVGCQRELDENGRGL